MTLDTLRYPWVANRWSDISSSTMIQRQNCLGIAESDVGRVFCSTLSLVGVPDLTIPLFHEKHVEIT